MPLPFRLIAACTGLYVLVAASVQADGPVPADGSELRTFSISFQSGASVPGADAAAVVRAAAKAARADDARVVIGGHADRTGNAAVNLMLSAARARWVRQALVRAGVPSGRIAVIAYGETFPKAVTADGVSEPANRRVDILIGLDRPL